MKKVQILIFGLLALAASMMAQDVVQPSQRNDITQDTERLLLHQCRRGIHRPERLIRRVAGGQDRGPGGNYFTGEKHQLVVLAAFADQAFLGSEEATIKTWDSIFNIEHLNQEPFVGSVHDYFYDQSYGQFDLVFDLQYVTVGQRERYQSTEEDDENSQYLVMDIVDSLEKRDIDWSLYDWNGDGYVNQLLIIYAWKGSSYGNFGGDEHSIWPHQLWLSEHLKDGKQGAYCDPRKIDYKGKKYLVDSYCAVQELDRNDTYGTFGVLCHEFTHCFGFPDFYSYEISTTPHTWELMDYGNNNGNGFCPPSYSAHERWLMGWLTPTELTTAMSITELPALSDEPKAYLIRNDNRESEYYIVENRQQKGWDASLPGSGIVIFHIDYVPSLWLGGSVNSLNEQHCMIFCANNKSHWMYCSGWTYPYGENNSLTDTSEPAATLWHPNSNGTKLMSKPLSNLSVTDGKVSFDYMSPATNKPAAFVGTQPHKVLHNGQLYIIRDGKAYTVHGFSAFL